VRLENDYGLSAIRVHAPGSNAAIENCEILNLDDPGDGRGLELIDGTHCAVRNCAVSGWGYGLLVNMESDPLVEGCTITENTIGVMVYEAGSYAAYPDLGGGDRGSLGGNVIQDNTECGVKNQTDEAIWALNNTWNNDPPTEGQPYPCDVENTGEGSIVF